MTFGILLYYLVPLYRCTGRPMAGLSVTKFFHWLLSRNSADCSISFSVDPLTSTASLTLSIHRFLGLPLGRAVFGFHSSHPRAVLLVDILLTCPYHLNCASSINCRMLFTCSSALMSSFCSLSLRVTPLMSLSTQYLLPTTSLMLVCYHYCCCG